MVKLRELGVILDLHRQGLSLSAIARQTGLDRKTVRRYVEHGLEPPAYQLRWSPETGQEAKCLSGKSLSHRNRVTAQPTFS